MLQQFHQFETNVTAPDGGKARWHARYALEEAEIRRALTLSERRRTGPVKIALESGVAAVIGIVCLINYFTDSARTASTLMIGVLCFVLAAVALLYSPVSVRSIAKREAGQQKKVNLWVSEAGVGFGKKAEHYKEIAYDEMSALFADDLLVLIPAKNTLIAVPKAAVNEECWAFLIKQLTPADKQEKSL